MSVLGHGRIGRPSLWLSFRRGCDDTFRMTRHGGRPRAAAVVSVAALLVATSSGCGSAPRNQRSRSASSSAVAAAVGHQWRLMRVTVAGSQLDVPDSIDATFQLASDGRFLASDTVNALSGTYTATRTGFTVTSVASTAVGYAGTDRTRLAVIASMDAVLGHHSAVAAQTSRTTLTLNLANYRLTFGDVGPAVSYPPPSATSTTTPTHS
jgi:heat shock protein HslJ